MAGRAVGPLPSLQVTPSGPDCLSVYTAFSCTCPLSWLSLWLFHPGRATLRTPPTREQKAKPRPVSLSLRLNISKSVASPVMELLTLLGIHA